MKKKNISNVPSNQNIKDKKSNSSSKKNIDEKGSNKDLQKKPSNVSISSKKEVNISKIKEDQVENDRNISQVKETEIEKEIKKNEKNKTNENIINNYEISKEDEIFLGKLAQKLESIDKKITIYKKEETALKTDQIINLQTDIKVNIEKIINSHIKENTNAKDLKLENTMIEVVSNNYELKETIEDMKKAFKIKNEQINSLQEELNRYKLLTDEQEKQIDYLENKLQGKEKIINVYKDQKIKNENFNEINKSFKSNEINEKKSINYLDNNNNYDIWRTKNDDNDSANEKGAKNLEDILGKKANLWILKHESELTTNKKKKNNC